jgi:capsular polysaccharide transport system permease protein
LVVFLPAVTGAIYLRNIAIDQYHSTTAFSVRSDESLSVSALQNAFTQGASPSTIDAEIIQEFIRSQAIVERISDQVDLQTIYIRDGKDIVFELSPNAGIEDIVRYWNRMVRVTVAANTGLAELKVKAFSPQDARILSEMILKESSDVVNALSVSAEDNYMEAAYTRRLETEETLRMARSAV